MRSLRRFTVLCGLRAAAFKCLGQSEYIQVALTTLYGLPSAVRAHLQLLGGHFATSTPLIDTLFIGSYLPGMVQLLSRSLARSLFPSIGLL